LLTNDPVKEVTMNVASPEKALLKLLWEVESANGRPPGVPLSEIAQRVRTLQRAGVWIYASDTLEDLTAALKSDAALLERLGYVKLSDDRAELTGAGEFFGGVLRFPQWAEMALSDGNQDSRHSLA